LLAVGCPDSGSGWNTLVAPSLTAGRPVAWPAAAMRDDPVWLLPWRLLAPPYHPAGHAKSQHRQYHADGTPQRPASHRQQCAGQGPDQRAVQQPGQLGLSWGMRVGAGHGASSGHRDTVQVRRWPANGWFEPPSKPPSAACAEQPWPGTVAGGAAASQGTCSDDAQKNAISRRGVAASPASANAAGRPALPSRSGDIQPGRQRQHSVVEGGCCGVGMSDRRGRVR
jgi:hypothetical protein